MGARAAGVISFTQSPSIAARSEVQVDPVVVDCQIVEVGMSHNAPANNTDAPLAYRFKRTSTVGTKTTQAPVSLQSGRTTALSTLGNVDHTVEGSLVEELHQFYVPTVSGLVWVAAPGREIDCIPAEFFSVERETATPAAFGAQTYLVFEE